ncbi:MAG: hypothetical protein KAI66_06490, partial [Lentisphaeria bacterium]|nr:hypothetical protein [Lentisphaeria bacterium]
VYRVNWRTGTVRCQFSLRLQPGARLMHEWRTSMPPFVASGPRFETDDEGRLVLPGHEPLKIPFGEWVRFRVECPLGNKPGRTWRLTVRMPDASEKQFTELPVPEKFDRMGWIGFISAGSTEAVFHLDDVSLEAVR